MGVLPVFAGRVTHDGRLLLDRRQDFARYTRTFADQPVELLLRKPKSQRSTQANAYYWGVVIALLAEHCGYEPDELHEVLAMRFLRLEDDPLTGAPRRQSTAKLSVEEFGRYVEQCAQFAAEHGVVIPGPNEVDVEATA